MSYYDEAGNWHPGTIPNLPSSVSRGDPECDPESVTHKENREHYSPVLPRPPGWQESAEELSVSRPNTLVLEVNGLRSTNKPWPIVWSKTDNVEEAFNLNEVRGYLAKHGRKSKIGITAYWNGEHTKIIR
jgi:hypothetical protein